MPSDSTRRRQATTSSALRRAPNATGCGESLYRQRELRLPVERPVHLQLAAVQSAFGVLRLNVPVKDKPVLLPVELSYLVMYSIDCKAPDAPIRVKCRNRTEKNQRTVRIN
jgi:hypothetical protein